MNIMNDLLITFEKDRGQNVAVSYRHCCEQNIIVRHTWDQSSDENTYEYTPCPDDVEWNGSEGIAPFDPDEMIWKSCENFFGVED